MRAEPVQLLEVVEESLLLVSSNASCLMIPDRLDSRPWWLIQLMRVAGRTLSPMTYELRLRRWYAGLGFRFMGFDWNRDEGL